MCVSFWEGIRYSSLENIIDAEETVQQKHNFFATVLTKAEKKPWETYTIEISMVEISVAKICDFMTFQY